MPSTTYGFQAWKRFKSLKTDSNKCPERTKKWLLRLVVKDAIDYLLFFFNFIIIIIIIILAALGLRCCTRAFSSCSERGLLFVAVRGLLIAVASPVAEHGL